ncbi:MAG: DUF6693 family protein [Gammaproteobacteria bacterium]
MKLKGNVSTIEILAHLIIWFLLTVVTLGIALFFFPYSFSKFIINNFDVIDDQGVARRMSCNIGHVILWAIISILTLGIGYIFYTYKVWNYSLNHTTVG